MPLSSGTRLGAYDIVALIGSGGMGEVYRARDTRLNREVAIKILPEAFAADAHRVARFQREAQVLASLNHPNIAQIHGLEEADHLRGLILELVEGPTLADRIAQAPIPVDEALSIARQIAEALEAAHEQGIIHRDLKPANIKLRPDGTVKVLDFGLAKALGPNSSSATEGDLSQSPTITSPAMATHAGIILGTAAYMAPEQAKGRPADKRSDVWAFGCVLYEMVTGAPPFDGEDTTDVLGAVVRLEPDWSRLPVDTPPAIRTLLQGCLTKDRRQRVGDIAAALFALKAASLGTPGDSATAATGRTQHRSRSAWRRVVPLAAAAIAGGIVIGLAMWNLKPLGTSARPAVTRFSIPLGEGQSFTGLGRRMLALSPDGTEMVYSANARLYLRSMSDLEAQPIRGTETFFNPNHPVFSPDGRSVVFYAGGTLKTILLTGGAAVTLCQASSPFGISWVADTILFGQGAGGIMRVSARGGTPERVISVGERELAHGPQLLPDGQTVLFTLAEGSASSLSAWDSARVVAQSLTTGERKILIDGGSDARYLPTGHLVYALGGVVMAVPFDTKRLALGGSPVPVVEGVRRLAGPVIETGSAQFATSDTGSLVYVPGPVSGYGHMNVGFFGRNGGSEFLKIAPGPYQLPRMSPDGKQIALGSDDGKEAIIWIYDLAGSGSPRRLTFDGHNRFPVWSADSQRVAFQSNREGDFGIFWQRADGTGVAERLTNADKGTSHVPESWAPGGERFLYHAAKGGTTTLWVFSLKEKQAARFDSVESPDSALPGAAFSPDGRWVAYASRAGRTTSAVYVQPFPPTGAKYQISKNTENGAHPVWSPDGTELLFTPGPGPRLTAARLTFRPGFSITDEMPVTRLFRNYGPNVVRPYDTTRDGQRILGLVEADEALSGSVTGPQIRVVINWFEELKRLSPPK